MEIEYGGPIPKHTEGSGGTKPTPMGCLSAAFFLMILACATALVLAFTVKTLMEWFG